MNHKIPLISTGNTMVDLRINTRPQRERQRRAARLGRPKPKFIFWIVKR